MYKIKSRQLKRNETNETKCVSLRDGSRDEIYFHFYYLFVRRRWPFAFVYTLRCQQVDGNSSENGGLLFRIF